MLRALDLIGKRFGKLVVLSLAESRNHKSRCLCKCDCGNIKEVGSANLVRLSTRSCGCLLSEVLAIRNKTMLPGGYADKDEAFVNIVLSDYKRTAQARCFEWELTNEFCVVLFKSNCYYCGSPPSSVRKSKKPGAKRLFTYTGIDRVVNSKGYTVNNVVPCCKICNHAKGAMDQSEFLAWVDRLIDYRGSNETLP